MLRSFTTANVFLFDSEKVCVWGTQASPAMVAQPQGIGAAPFQLFPSTSLPLAIQLQFLQQLLTSQGQAGAGMLAGLSPSGCLSPTALAGFNLAAPLCPPGSHRPLLTPQWAPPPASQPSHGGAAPPSDE